MKVKESNIKESMPSGGLDTIMPPSLSSEMPSPPMMRKGGNVKKCSTGGALKNVDAEDNPGLAELPTHVRNKMGYKRNGGKIC